MTLPLMTIDRVIRRGLEEDITYLDVTTDYLIPENAVCAAKWTAKADGIICGLEIGFRVFALMDDRFTVDGSLHDGDPVKAGQEVARFHGSTRALLKGERTALNLLQHLSGIATATAKAVKAVEGTRAQITDTRKTLPGLRALQKYAVTVGGGKNHRFNLSDGAMLKDNHIDAAGGIPQAVAALRGKIGHMVQLEVETRTLREVQQALESGAQVIMLDNMRCEEMKQAVEYVRGRALLEASGGITFENLREVAQTGVDIISLGALTHSVQALDISMTVDKQPEKAL